VKRLTIVVPRENQGDDRALARRDGDRRFLGLLGKGGDAVDGVLHVRKDVLRIGIQLQLDGGLASPLASY
jgi:hypothetical protein